MHRGVHGPTKFRSLSGVSDYRDRHKIWRVVAANWEDWNGKAPDGWEAVVEVTLPSGEKVLVDQVTTTREPDFPWVILHSLAEGTGEAPHSSRSILFLPDHSVQLVMIRFRIKDSEQKGQVGFAYTELPRESSAG